MTELFYRAGFPRAKFWILTVFIALPTTVCLAESESGISLRLEIAWGHHSAVAQPCFVKLLGRELLIGNLSVTVNGQNWTDFDVGKEWVRILNPTQLRYIITTHH